MNSVMNDMRNKIIKSIIVLSVLIALTVLTGCNTSEGVGKDLEQTGKNIQEKANEAK